MQTSEQKRDNNSSAPANSNQVPNQDPSRKPSTLDAKEELPRLPKLPRMNKPQGVASVALPEVSDIDRSDFSNEIKSMLGALGKESQVYQNALDAMNKNQYKFIAYDANNNEIPQEIRNAMAGGRFAALTVPALNRVFVHLEAIEGEAKQRNIPSGQMLALTLANESVHVQSNRFYPHFDKAATQKAFAEMATAEAYTKSEQVFHEFLVEELTSEMTMKIVEEQFANPDYKLSQDSLKENAHRFQHSKFVLARSGLKRMFTGVDSESRNKSQIESTVVNRVRYFLESGEVERRVTENLREQGLLK